MSNRSVLSVVVVLSALTFGAHARAERPRGTYQWAPPDRVDVSVARGHNSNVIYLNRCEGGCTISPGFEDSRQNTSSIIDATSTIDEFPYGDQAWDSVVSCVQAIYEPFNIEVTDQDPGNQPHFETIVAGDPEDIGQPGNVGGVSPFTCAIINNAITYNFANVWPDMRDLCETVAQETAHAFGLDHEFLCEDPMTYLTGCGEKAFRDVDAECGEYEARECLCGGFTQNSYAFLLGHFDASAPTPPSVEIVRPQADAQVQPSFEVEVAAQDNVSIENVAVFLNGAPMAESATGPYLFTAPADLPDGDLMLRVVATDNRGDTAERTIRLTQAAACSAGDDSCADGEVCLDGRCMAGPSSQGGLGSTCSINEDCQSGTCGDDGEVKYCTAPCDGGACPAGFECLQGGAQGFCWPASEEPEEASGCRTVQDDTGVRGGLGFAGALLVVGLLVVRRRRSRT